MSESENVREKFKIIHITVTYYAYDRYLLLYTHLRLALMYFTAKL